MRRLWIVALILLGARVASAQDIPLPTLPAGIETNLNAGIEGINELPTNPGDVGGVNLVPQVDAMELFKYTKYLLSPEITRELFGETFAPIADSTAVILLLTVSLTVTYFAVRAIVITVRIAIFLLNLAIEMAQLAIAAFDAVKPG